MLRPVAGPLSPTVAATMSRSAAAGRAAVALVALAAAFAASTAIVQRDLPAAGRGRRPADQRRRRHRAPSRPAPRSGRRPPRRSPRVPGVASVEPLQHRFAYVGTDLQDLYGVRADARSSPPAPAGRLLRRRHGARAAHAQPRRGARRDPGQRRDRATTTSCTPATALTPAPAGPAPTRAASTVPFHYVGVANEFPTAPRDSFLVANADYVAARPAATRSGRSWSTPAARVTTTVADAVRAAVGTCATVTDIDTRVRVVGSSLTSVDLAGPHPRRARLRARPAPRRQRAGAGPRLGRAAPHLRDRHARWAPQPPAGRLRVERRPPSSSSAGTILGLAGGAISPRCWWTS